MYTRLNHSKNFQNLKGFIQNTISLKIYEKNELKLLTEISTNRILSLVVYDYLNLHIQNVSLNKDMANLRIENKSISIHVKDKIIKISKRIYAFETIMFLQLIIKIFFKLIVYRISIKRFSRILFVYSLTSEQSQSKSGADTNLFFLTLFSHKKIKKILYQNRTSGFFRHLISEDLIRYLSAKQRLVLFFDLLRIIRVLVTLSIFNRYLTIGCFRFLDGWITSYLVNKLDLQTTCVCTQSEMTSLPGYFYFNKKIDNFMLWYSDNSLPIGLNKKSIKFDLSYLQNKLIGNHYVQSMKFQKVIKNYNEARVRVIRPFSFFEKYPLRLAQKSNKQPSEMLIGYFPVTPYASTKSEDIYSENYMIKDLQVISDLVKTKRNEARNRQVIVKLKRVRNKNHSQNYFSLLNKMEENKRIKVVDSEEDISEILSNLDVVICTPFTTIGLLAKYMGKKVIFFTNSTDHCLPREYEGIKVFQGRKNLQKYMANL